jgi:hypothetical protein
MPDPISARVELRDERPTLLLNDEPVAPLLYALTDCPGGRFTWEEVPQRNIAEFGACGTRLFQADIWLEQMLDEAGNLDISFARRQIAGVTAVVPDGTVQLRLHVNPPPEWIAAHPDEWVGYADTEPQDYPRHGLMRPLADDGENAKRASFYSEVWQDWAHQKLREFCTALATTPEGDALFSIQVANGVYGEWHQFGFLKHDPDTGPAATQAFRRWLAEHYADDAALAAAWGQPDVTLANATPPDTPSRETAALGILRDPQTQQQVIDSYTFQHLELTQLILDLCATTKAAWPRPIVTAAFFGYFYGIFGRQCAGAQLGVEAALTSPHLDCFCSPQAYEDGARDMGGPGTSRGIIGVARRHGKLWLDEMDLPTSNCGCPWKDDFKSTPADDLAIHRRNVLQPYVRGGGQWWYDFGPVSGVREFARAGNAGWWDTPELLEDARAIQALAAERLKQPYTRPADILLVQAPMSLVHCVSRRHPPAEFGETINPDLDPVTPLIIDDFTHALNQCGSVFDEALLCELDTLDLSPYRLVIFATTAVLSAAERETVRQRVACEGRHVVFLGYAGWGDHQHIGPQLASSLTGIETQVLEAETPAQTLNLGGIKEERALTAPLAVPTYAADDDEIIGRWADGSASAVRRSDKNTTTWTFALPPTTPAFLQALARAAGCHAVNDHAETTLVGEGLIIVHTATGGTRTLQWPGNPAFTAEVAPRTTTVFDGPTGQRLLG